MGERGYVMVSGRDGTPRYEIKDSQRNRLLGYLRNVALCRAASFRLHIAGKMFEPLIRRALGFVRAGAWPSPILGLIGT